LESKEINILVQAYSIRYASWMIVIIIIRLELFGGIFKGCSSGCEVEKKKLWTLSLSGS